MSVSVAANGDVIPCPTERIHQEDQRIEFHPRDDGLDTTFFEVRAPKLPGYELKSASIEYKLGGEHTSTMGAALAMFEAEGYFYSEGSFEVGSQRVSVIADVRYSDGSRCDLVLMNTWKHNKSFKDAAARQRQGRP